MLSMVRHPRTGRGQLFKLGWLALFGISMAYLEAAVVVYLRQLFWPTGSVLIAADLFQAQPPPLLGVEIGREATTIIMLVSLGMAVGTNGRERLALFLWAAGLWDIFYYVWLYVLLGWPPSPLTPDLLFLIPVPWIGPVVAPMLVSAVMLLLALAILRGQPVEEAGHMRRYWVLAVLAAWLIFSSFTIANYGPAANLWNDLLVGLLILVLALSAVTAKQT